MKICQASDIPVLDCHIHYAHPSLMPSLIETCDNLRIDRFNIVCTPHQQRLSLVPDALHLKAHHPARVYVFGGLNVAAYFMAPQDVGEIFAEFVDLLLAAGCDGVKMIEKDGWVILRASNTEPVIRISAEARTEEKLNQLYTFAVKELKKAMKR